MMVWQVRVTPRERVFRAEVEFLSIAIDGMPIVARCERDRTNERNRSKAHAPHLRLPATSRTHRNRKFVRISLRQYDAKKMQIEESAVRLRQ